ncbi:DUF3726 domain-containing protein [Rhodobacterales bacterium HKCCE3408]|nr:DUF3726 domain-containing protein [Rhodobacterales bacterium HKCCE3408]
MTDPTGQGVAPPSADVERLSLGEIEAICQKAARGAGLDWGLAEEAGFAARWLCARGIDGAAALLAVLEREDVGPAVLAEGVIRAQGLGVLSPVAVGTVLSDFAGLLPHRVTTGPVAQPVLVLPFLQGRREAASLAWDGGAVCVGADGALSGEVAALAAADLLHIEISASRLVGPEWSGTEPRIAACTLARLDALALRTTVPASDASRAGAGSAGDDND